MGCGSSVPARSAGPPKEEEHHALLFEVHLQEHSLEHFAAERQQDFCAHVAKNLNCDRVDIVDMKAGSVILQTHAVGFVHEDHVQEAAQKVKSGQAVSEHVWGAHRVPEAPKQSKKMHTASPWLQAQQAAQGKAQAGGKKPKPGESQLERRQLEERRELQAREALLVSERASLQAQLQTSEAAYELHKATSQRSVVDLQAELQTRQADHQRELAKQREDLTERHKASMDEELAAQDASLRAALQSQMEVLRKDTEGERASAAAARQTYLEELSMAAEQEASQYRAEAETATQETTRLNQEMLPLQSEYEAACKALADARAALSEQTEQHKQAAATAAAQSITASEGAAAAASLERRLLEAQTEQLQCQQRYASFETHAMAQMTDLRSELRTRNEELQQRSDALRSRDQELSEVNGQLAELQRLFDEVNKQLQAECARVAKLQASVSNCAKQSKELESLQGMVEDSHRMLAQVRSAMERETAERVRTSGLLEHEQQRTRLLLDVLKHFKEKLQGLAPQMLLNRLGGANAKGLLGSPSGLEAAGLLADPMLQPSPGLSKTASTNLEDKAYAGAVAARDFKMSMSAVEGLDAAGAASGFDLTAALSAIVAASPSKLGGQMPNISADTRAPASGLYQHHGPASPRPNDPSSCTASSAAPVAITSRPDGASSAVSGAPPLSFSAGAWPPRGRDSLASAATSGGPARTPSPGPPSNSQAPSPQSFAIHMGAASDVAAGCPAPVTGGQLPSLSQPTTFDWRLALGGGPSQTSPQMPLPNSWAAAHAAGAQAAGRGVR
eukprot:TRINITY_DN38382_c0_g1_i1.p1 TRINITY_DN38382_c0_g1~~TRINITY_DN38382_c0_g1_i1.p1  ORF type:complete len:790 (-),score=254.57 TRINITY_DN38382_c0_g1_i1:112-2481(-)